MKIIAHPEKIKRFERDRKIASIHIDEKKLRVATPVSAAKLKQAKKMAEDKDRPWDIEKTKQLLKVQTGKLKGKKLFAEAGREIYKLDVQTDVKKVVIGEKVLDLLFEPYLTYYSGEGEVGFAGDVPGEMAVLEIEPKESILAQKASFIASIGDIDLSVEHRKLKNIGSVLFGGESFLLTKLTNISKEDGLVFFHACGGYDIIELNENQTISVDVGSVVAWEDTVDFNVERSDIKSGIVGGEGMFVNNLTGPGVVVVQTTTPSKMKEMIGETICLGPPPIVMWQLIQKEAKRIFSRILIGR